MLLNQFGLGSDMSGHTAHWIIDDKCVMHNELAHALDVKASNDERKLFTSLYLNEPEAYNAP